MFVGLAPYCGDRFDHVVYLAGVCQVSPLSVE